VLSEEFKALLCTGGGLDNNVIEHSAGSGDGNIVLFIDGGEATRERPVLDCTDALAISA